MLMILRRKSLTLSSSTKMSFLRMLMLYLSFHLGLLDSGQLGSVAPEQVMDDNATENVFIRGKRFDDCAAKATEKYTESMHVCHPFL